MHLTHHHPGLRLPAAIDLGPWFDAHTDLGHAAHTVIRDMLEMVAADTIAVDDSVQAAYESGPEYFADTYGRRFGEWIDQAHLARVLPDGADFAVCDGVDRDSLIAYAADAAYTAVTRAVGQASVAA